MGYANRSKDGRWGLPVVLAALILGLVLFGSVTAPSPAFAAAITCGGCHSNPPSDSDSACPKQTSKSHPSHSTGSDLTTCDRCHQTVAGPKGDPTAKHNNNVNNITSVVAVGMRYTGGSCSKACHKNKDNDAPWGGAINCNSCTSGPGPSAR